jgi:hypothetical protein
VEDEIVIHRRAGPGGDTTIFGRHPLTLDMGWNFLTRRGRVQRRDNVGGEGALVWYPRPGGMR